MLLLFTSERKSKHPTFILASYGAVFTSERKRKHPTFILASYGAVFTSERKSKHPTFILASYGVVFTSERKSKHPTFILASVCFPSAEEICSSRDHIFLLSWVILPFLYRPNIFTSSQFLYRPPFSGWLRHTPVQKSTPFSTPLQYASVFYIGWRQVVNPDLTAERSEVNPDLTTK